MTRSLDKKSALLRYQCILAVGAIFAFYSNLDVYLSNVWLPPIPKYLVFLFCIASTPLLFSVFSRIKYLPIPTMLWCVGYVLLAFISFCLTLPSEATHQEVQNRVLAGLFLMIMIFIFSRYSIVHFWSRCAVLVTVLVSVFNNIYEFFNQSAFENLATSNIEKIAGRSSGFYIDPNQSGYALILGMIFSVGLLKPRFRIPFVLLIGLAVILTFSRGSILICFTIIILMIIRKIIPRPQLFSWIGVIGIIAILLVTVGSTLDLNQLEEAGLLNSDTKARFQFFSNPENSEAESPDARLGLAKLAWQLFVKNPFFGNGIGSTISWSAPVSTHNTYLYYMADHGIIGALLLPILIYLVTRKASSESKNIAFVFLPCVLMCGFFSHTILVDRFILIMCSLMSCMSMTSQVEQRSKVGNKL